MYKGLDYKLKGYGGFMQHKLVTKPLKKHGELVANLERALAQVVANSVSKTQIIATINYYENGQEGLMMSVSFQGE